jgi:hypothetical protein
MSDDWDSIINLEEQMFKSGFIEGKEYVSSFLKTPENDSYNDDEDDFNSNLNDSIKQSLQFGFMKGFSIGIELGYIENNANQYHLHSQNCNENFVEENLSTKYNDNDTVEDVKIDNKDDNYSSVFVFEEKKKNRTDKRVKNLIREINEIPVFNSSNIDFDQEIIKIRNLYKQSGLEKPQTLESVLNSLPHRSTDSSKNNNISDW